MAQGQSFEAFLQTVRTAWLRACAASAMEHQAAEADWTAVSDEGPPVPRRAVFRAPPRAPSTTPAALEIEWADLWPRQWMRPAGLSLAFDCELRQGPNGSWEMLMVHPEETSWLGTPPRHQVEILFDDPDGGGGVVRFDGYLWRRFGATAGEPRT